ncbi:hypothetical protein FHR90_001857 [Endobacter medicaginis]|uniref:Uncharacterized protein n=1 Tax=Endobacter medicaginis TaxID=1181271 RepID=A0A850NQP8_9PROT|nr:hypothetical protein [Endobacter medicaginis]MBB3174025.1 hypothetical protein [Endobacter medicaginis]MCX5475118.1 hypothetical protein [Endobacter medicaginis]NVN30470.1 hypothetical protein [Endobacter medicaginis]
MSGHAGLGKVLSRWREGIVRVFDIVPAELLARPPRVGQPVMLGWVDIELREGQPVPPRREPNWQIGRLEEAADNYGQPALSVDDQLFRAILPGDAAPPLCLAGYHMSFLHGLLGGPWDLEPRRLCLYRTGQLFDLGAASGDFSLSGMARHFVPRPPIGWDAPLVVDRVNDAVTVLRGLLRISRLNMLVALSCTKFAPPPASEPFGRMPQWQAMPGADFHDYE